MDKKFSLLIFVEFWVGSLLIAIGIGAKWGWASGLITFGVTLLTVGLINVWVMMENADKEKQSQQQSRTDMWMTKSVEKERREKD